MSVEISSQAVSGCVFCGLEAGQGTLLMMKTIAPLADRLTCAGCLDALVRDVESYTGATQDARQIADLKDDVAALRKQSGTLAALLVAAEWSAGFFEDRCPWCRRHRFQRHSSTCGFVAAMWRRRGP